MFSFFYDIILILLALCALPKFLWQMCTKGKYRKSIRQRFGHDLPELSLKPGQKLLWIHSVSMGETRAVIPFFRMWREQYPDWAIVISTTTETGQAEAIRSMPEAEAHFYLPFDFSWVIKRTMKKLSPSCLILVEGDIWYHLLSEAKNRGARLFLINAKISERSAKRFRLIATFAKRLFSLFDAICLQSELHRQRFLSIGVPEEKLFITGNIKLDVAPKPLSSAEKQAFKTSLGIAPTDRVLVIGSSHHPEEEQLLAALQAVWEKIPNLKVILVPRHPERFAQVHAMLKDKGIATLTFSKRDQKGGGERVILVDAMGQLTTCYQIADIALVAGSYVAHVGGHNICEPILHANIPVLFGPHMHSQLDLRGLVLQAHAGIEVSLNDLPHILLNLLQNPQVYQKYVQACQQLSRQVQGSTKRTFERISALNQS